MALLRKDLIGALIDKLDKAEQEEGSTSLKYLDIVDELERLGLYNEARVVRAIAEDESKHQHQLIYVIHELRGVE